MASLRRTNPANSQYHFNGRNDLRKRYWGQHLWAHGYFCATVGAVDEATITAAILALTDQLYEDNSGFSSAISMISGLTSEYDRAYYSGSAWERRAKAYYFPEQSLQR